MSSNFVVTEGTDTVRYCSFCGISDAEAGRLFTAAKAAMCDSCVGYIKAEIDKSKAEDLANGS